MTSGRTTMHMETMPLMKSTFRIVAAGCVALLVAAESASQPAFAVALPPQLDAGQAPPVARPYDAPEAAHKAVEAAFEQARATNKRVLIDFGANWCPDCRMLSGVMQLGPVQPWIKHSFVPVLVNVDHFNVNMDIAQQYGVTIKAIPAVLIVTPEGRLLNADGARELGNARAMSAQAVVDLIAAWNRRS